MNISSIIVSITPHAIAVALSPIPIATLILLLLSKKAKVNSILFLVGWIIALIINVGFFAFVANMHEQSNHSKSTVVSSLINAVLGILLLYLAVKNWRNRPKPGETPPLPKWMQSLETLSPIMAFFIAFSLVTINAKNTVVNIATGVIIGQATNSILESFYVIVIYSILASIIIIMLVLAFLLLGSRLNNTLQLTKQWFIYNSAIILFILFLFLGISLLSKAFIH